MPQVTHNTRTAAQPHQRQRRSVRMTWPQRFLFAGFVFTAFVLFASVVWLPLIQQYTHVLDEERALSMEVKRLQNRDASLARFAESIESNPDVIERLAMQDFGYIRPGETSVRLDPVRLAALMDDGSLGGFQRTRTILPSHWPLWSHQLETWAAQRGLLTSLMNPELRSSWLMLATGMVVAAFVLFAPRRHDDEDAPAAAAAQSGTVTTAAAD